LEIFEMKHNRLFLLMAAAGLAAAGSAGATSATGTGPAAAAPAGSAPDTNAASAEKPKRAPKNPDNILDIINGRLPLALVYLIRFKETGTTAERAKKYGTSVGKVFDIIKGRNFGYIAEGYKPSTDEVAAAKAWCETGKTAKGKSLKEAGGDPDAIMAAVSALGVATAEEVAARNWATRTVGQTTEVPVAANGAAPAAAAAAPAAGAKGAPAGSGAKLF
jgi:hypothetical protein